MSGSRPRQVRFADRVRPLRDDEVSVIETFTTHTRLCKRCFKTLCTRGQACATDVANYIYMDAGRPYSVIDRRANLGHVGLDIKPSLFEVIQRALKAVQESPAPNFRTCYEATKKLNPGTYEIVEVLSEGSRRREKKERRTSERTYFANSKPWRRQTEYSCNQVKISNHCTSGQGGGQEDIVWVKIPLKRSELRRLVC